MNRSVETAVQVRVDGDPAKPCLIYLPGVHGDWTLFTSFRELAKEKFHLIQITYPRTLDWRIEDYARAVSDAVSQLGVNRGWVLAESYSSQVGWAWLDLTGRRRSAFQFEGIILAGGFVRYPVPFLVRAVGKFFDVAPWRLWKVLFWIYIRYSGFRHRHAPGSAAAAHEFVARRTPLDVAAMRHRLRLIHQYDPRTVAAAAKCPVYLLAGMIDPVVPTWPVLRWLRKNCPTFRARRMVWPADHNVLGTEPAKSLEQIERWTAGSKR